MNVQTLFRWFCSNRNRRLVRPALVYIAAFAPDQGGTALGLIARSTGSLLPLALLPAPFVGADRRLGVNTQTNPLLSRTVFAQDVPSGAARQMAATQRPATLVSGATLRACPLGARARPGTWPRATAAPSQPPSSGSWPSARTR
jgi:hypothetical protein